MSDFSLIHSQYNRVKDVSENFNNAVIIVKKRSLQAKAKTIHVSEDAYEKANQNLVTYMTDIENLINEETSIESGQNNEFRTNDELMGKITSLKTKIIQKEQPTIQDFIVLDKVLNIIENQKTQLFRKLRTSRI